MSLPSDGECGSYVHFFKGKEWIMLDGDSVQYLPKAIKTAQSLSLTFVDGGPKERTVRVQRMEVNEAIDQGLWALSLHGCCWWTCRPKARNERIERLLPKEPKSCYDFMFSRCSLSTSFHSPWKGNNSGNQRPKAHKET